MAIISSEYKSWIGELKQRIRQSQIKAAVKVNTELLWLYWQLGCDIVERQLEASWGSGFFNQLSKDLKDEFPQMAGFSPTNLKYMKRFYLFYNQDDEIRQQLADELEPIIFKIPWFHQVNIITKCSNTAEALFYTARTIEYGWSRSVLEHQIELNLYEREGKAITNFTNTLPMVQSDLVQQVTKDPYIIDIMGIRQEMEERELEAHLDNNISQYLLELGKGFTYYGHQVHLRIGDEDFYIDQLFYHVRLHCYVVVELKAVKFKPEHIGQLNFYVAAVDNQMRTQGDNPTIGILICKDKNDVVVEYTLQNVENPIGVSSLQIYDQLTADYKSSLPTIEEIEAQLKDKEI